MDEKRWYVLIVPKGTSDTRETIEVAAQETAEMCGLVCVIGDGIKLEREDGLKDGELQDLRAIFNEVAWQLGEHADQFQFRAVQEGGDGNASV